MPNQDEIEQQRRLLETHRGNLALYLIQRVQLGKAYIPPGIANGIHEERQNISRIKAILRDWGAEVEDHPDDYDEAENTNRTKRVLRNSRLLSASRIKTFSGHALLVWIGFVCAIILIIIGYFRVYEWKFDTTTIIISGIGVAYICSLFLFLFFRTKSEKKSIGYFGNKPAGIKSPYYSTRVRVLSFLFAILLPVLLISNFFYTVHLSSQPPDDFVILIANFDNGISSADQYGVTETVMASLRSSLGEYGDVRIQSFGRTIKEGEETNNIRIEALRRKASVIIWGWYRVTGTNVQMFVRVENLWQVYPSKSFRVVECDYIGRNTGKAPPIAGLEDFTIQTSVAEDMIFLNLLISGRVQYVRGDYASAINRFSEALQQPIYNNQKLQVYYFRGLAYLSDGEYDKSVNDFSELINIDSDYSWAYYYRGLALLLSNKRELAVGDFSRAIQRNPDVAEIYFHRAVAETSVDPVAGIADYTKAINLQSDLPCPYINRGFLYLNKGDFNGARADFISALKTAPNFYKAHGAMGYYYEKIGNLREALRETNKAIELAPESDVGYFQRAEIYKNLGRRDLAIADFEEYLLLSKDEATKKQVEKILNDLRK